MKYLMIVLSAVFIFTSCKSGSNDAKDMSVNTQAEAPVQAKTTDIDIATAKTMIAQTKDLVLLDVRTPEEVALGKIGDAMVMDFTEPDFKEKAGQLDRNNTYIVYCAAGGRSSKAVAIMQDLGFDKAFNMIGGYTEWSKK